MNDPNSNANSAPVGGAAAAAPAAGAASDTSTYDAAAAGMLNTGGPAAAAGAAEPTATLGPAPVTARPGAPAGPQPTPPPKPMGTFDRILQSLGGGPKKSYSVDPESGKLVVSTQPATRGELARHVIAGMLTGIAAGMQQTGPGAPGRAFGAAFGATSQYGSAEEAMKKAQAEKDFQNNQAAMLRKAQIDRYNFEELMALRQNTRQDQEAWDTHMKSQADLIKQLDDMGVERPPILVEGKDVNAGETPGNDPDLMRAYTQGQLKAPQGSHLTLMTTRNDDGQMIHHVFSVSNNILNQEVRIPDDIREFYKMPDSANTLTLRQVLNLTSAMQDHRNNDINAQLKQEQIAEVKANIGKTQAETGEVEERTKQMREAEIAAGSDPFGAPIGRTANGETMNRKELDAAQKTFNKAYIDPLNVLQKTTMEFQRINSNPNQTGAERVTALLNAVGISGDPLKGKGFRINNDIIQEHAGARNIWESGVQKLNTIAGTGGPITAKQISDYTAVAQGVVHDAYVTAAQEARRQGLPVDFLPRATTKNQGADPFVAKIYLDAAGGNIDAAHKAMVAAGYAN